MLSDLFVDLRGRYYGARSWLLCRVGLHVWGGHLDGPGPGAWRCCAACGKYQEGAYDGIEAHWRSVAPPHGKEQS